MCKKSCCGINADEGKDEEMKSFSCAYVGVRGVSWSEGLEVQVEITRQL